ncbi:MAG: Wzy polymerase domain-containing protein [Azonexus sp.]|jgi:O-antigen ligase|nr:Wzy polymerase domain-containing protein [Azonexus sp.]
MKSLPFNAKHLFFHSRLSFSASTGLALALFALAWLNSLHIEPWHSFYSEALMALGLGLLLVDQIFQRKALPAPAVALTVALSGLIPALQYVFGLLTFAGDFWLSFFYLFGLALAISIGFARADDKNWPWLFALAVLSAAVISALTALAQFLEVAPELPWSAMVPHDHRSVGNLGQPNNLATLLAFGACSLLLLYERKKISPSLSLALFALLIIGMVTSQSRTGILEFIAGVSLTLMLRKKLGLRIWPWVPVVGLIALIALTLALPAIKAATSPGEAALAYNMGFTRARMWPILVEAAWQAPWAGYGWLHVGAAQLAVSSQFPPQSEFWFHAHNVFLDLILWNGLPLGLLLGASLVYWFWSRLKSLDSVESATAFMALLCLMTHACLELPHYYAYFLLPAGLWAGLVERKRRKTGSYPIIPFPASVAIVAVALVIFSGFCKDYFSIEGDFRKMRFQTLRIGYSESPTDRSAVDAYFLTTLTGHIRFQRTAFNTPLPAATLAEMEAATRRYPYAPSLYRMAIALAVNGQADKAFFYFNAIAHMHGPAFYKKSVQGAMDEYEKTRNPQIRALLDRLPPPG